MQTFLPYANYVQSALCLDGKRLGKQRLETKQLLNGYTHLAGRMWEGCHYQLCYYGIVICTEWRHRGNEDTLLDWFVGHLQTLEDTYKGTPHWFGSPLFHASHRSNLLRKDFDYYSQFGWTECTSLPYYWPSAGHT